MSNFSLTNLNILLPLLALALFIVCLIVFYFLIRKHRMPVQTDKIDQLYLKLREEYGRWPTPKECRDNYIDISELVKIHGSKGELDIFLETAEKAEKKHEKRIRNIKNGKRIV